MRLIVQPPVLALESPAPPTQWRRHLKYHCPHTPVDCYPNPYTRGSVRIYGGAFGGAPQIFRVHITDFKVLIWTLKACFKKQ